MDQPFESRLKFTTSIKCDCTTLKDPIKLVKEVKSHGKLVHTTGRSHLTSNTFFKTMELPVQAKKYRNWTKRRNRGCNLKRMRPKERRFWKWTSRQAIDATKQDKLFICHDVTKQEMGNKKEKQKMERYSKFKSTASTFSTMGPADEEEQNLKESKINLNKTALGYQKVIELKKVITIMGHLNFWELDKMDEK